MALTDLVSRGVTFGDQFGPAKLRGQLHVHSIFHSNTSGCLDWEGIGDDIEVFVESVIPTEIVFDLGIVERPSSTISVS